MKCPNCRGSNFGFAKRCDHCGADLKPPQKEGASRATSTVEDLSTGKPALLLKLPDGRTIRARPMRFAPQPSRDPDAWSVLAEPVREALTHLVNAGVPRDEALKYLPVLMKRSGSFPDAFGA